jgi:hypothetical protein
MLASRTWGAWQLEVISGSLEASTVATPKIMRIELKGQPSGEIYQHLHCLMTEELKWETSIIADTGARLTLPSATYCGENDKAALDLAVQLRDMIIVRIWAEGARVLVVDWATWGEATTIPW